ncbi:MAG: hypothetical protein MJ252_03325 [archaeon]|nr:hypothetical protein [archaeon]
MNQTHSSKGGRGSILNYPKKSDNDLNLNPSKINQVEHALYSMDTNAYRSYLMSNDFKRNQSYTPNPTPMKNLFLSNLPLNDFIHQKYDPMKIPFGYKSKRFHYQRKSKDFEGLELNGNLKKYYPNEKYKSFNFADLSKGEEEKKNIGHTRAYNAFYLSNMNSYRTMDGSKDILKTEAPVARKKFYLRSSSTGSIKGLLDKTPLEPKIRRRFRCSKENGIFSERFFTDNTFRRQKSAVNFDKIKNNGVSAGAYGSTGHRLEGYAQDYSFYDATKHADNILNQENKALDNYNRNNNNVRNNINHARRVKILSNMSDIFNIKGNVRPNNTKKGRRQYTYLYEESQKQY